MYIHPPTRSGAGWGAVAKPLGGPGIRLKSNRVLTECLRHPRVSRVCFLKVGIAVFNVFGYTCVFISDHQFFLFENCRTGVVYPIFRAFGRRTSSVWGVI